MSVPRKAFGASGELLPTLGQGTWDIPEHGARMAEAKTALRRGIELGMTHLDTAEMYGSGRAEEIVGEAIAGLPREQLFITSKVLPSNASYEGTLAACERSLRRLGLDHLDLYLLHWPSTEPVAETMRAFERLVHAGKTRYVGVSNFDVDELQEAQAALPGIPIACNQVLYHLRERSIEARLLPYCAAQEIAVVAYTPFGRAKLPDQNTSGGTVLADVAKKYDATIRQVMLAFLTRDADVFAIPKAASVAHVEENARALDFALEAQDIEAIDRAFPVRDRGTLATL